MNGRNPWFFLFGMVLYAALFAPSRVWSGAPGDKTVTLQTIIQSVEKNEALYQDSDVVMQARYDVGARMPEDPSIITEKNLRVHSVSQGGMFRIERTGVQQIGGETRSANHLCIFDGKTTRIFSPDGAERIVPRWTDDEYFVRPHMLLLRGVQVVPLSTYLQGHAAMAAHPNGHWMADVELDNSYEGKVEFAGLKCHRVWITTIAGGTPHDRWELLLAEERNFLPVHVLAYTFRFSKDKPVGEKMVKKWHEVKAGVWFPMSAQVTAFQKFRVRQGRQDVQWRERYEVEKVSLKPDYDVSFFRERQPKAQKGDDEKSHQSDGDANRRK